MNVLSKASVAEQQILQQTWTERAYCDEYASICEISTCDIHYGWLAPGESELGLLNDIDLRNASILDIGCGMGENLVSLNERGANCFGIDISPYMLEYAEKNISQAAKTPDTIFLQQEDMRNLANCLHSISFSLVLSIYSMEYLESIQDLRHVLAAVYNRLLPGGVFVFCFSHPLQHFRHCDLRNDSAHSDQSESSPIIYSFYDVVGCLDDVGFTIDRIIEQQTRNPSQMSYENSQQFPYHFSRGRNPCREAFDEFSNQAPHTVIYKVRKPIQKLDNAQRPLAFEYGIRTLWGESREIADIITINTGEAAFPVEKFVSPFDDVTGCCTILDFEVEREDIADLEVGSENCIADSPINIIAFKQNKIEDIQIDKNTLLGLIHSRITSLNLHPIYYEIALCLRDTISAGRGIYIQRIEPLPSNMAEIFPGCGQGLLIFINGEEPGSGKVNLEQFVPSIGDRIQLLYIATLHKPKKRSGVSKISSLSQPEFNLKLAD